MQDLDGYFAAFRILFCLRLVTRVAASVDAFFAVDFVAFFGVIFFSATWFTSPSRSRPFGAHYQGPQPHSHIVHPWDLGGVCRASREQR